MHSVRQTICRLLPLFAALVALVFGVTAYAQSENGCGDLKNHFGPFDYRTASVAHLKIVERFHFTPQVEALIKGESGYQVGPDLNYTLRVFPNHARALVSMMRYGEKLKSPQPADVTLPIACYFERALRFQPDDTTARMLHARFLANTGNIPDALAELNRVATTATDKPFTQYNVGLIYLDMKEYDKALQQAHTAMALGFPQTALKDKLVELDKWREPTDAASPTPPSQ